MNSHATVHHSTFNHASAQTRFFILIVFWCLEKGSQERTRGASVYNNSSNMRKIVLSTFVWYLALNDLLFLFFKGGCGRDVVCWGF